MLRKNTGEDRCCAEGLRACLLLLLVPSSLDAPPVGEAEEGGDMKGRKKAGKRGDEARELPMMRESSK